MIRQQSQTHCALLFPAAKPTNWIEGTQAVLRARKGQDEKVLVATCTSANGKPPSVVSWETRLKGEAEYQEIRNPNGTVTVISRYRLVPSREAHRQSLACIVNYHMDRFWESLTLNVQCERGRALGVGPPGGGGAHTVPSHPPPSYQPSVLFFPPLLPSPVYPSFLFPLLLPPPFLGALCSPVLSCPVFSLCLPSPPCLVPLLLLL